MADARARFGAGDPSATTPSLPVVEPLSFPLVTGNAYRVLGLGATASRSDIHAAGGSIKRTLKLGVQKGTDWDFPWLGPVERSEGLVQHSSGQLADVGRRLTERLFWFGPPGLDPAKAASDHPLTDHDRALHALCGAVVSDPAFLDGSRWASALAAWQAAVASENYWQWMLGLEHEGGFEPVANADDVKALRRQAVALAIAPIAEAAKAAVSSGDENRAGRALHVLQNAGLDDALEMRLENDIVGLAEAELGKLCDDICKECWGKIVREDSASSANKAPCKKAMERLNGEAIPRLERLQRIVGKESVFAKRSRGDVADALSQIAACWTWADEIIESENALKRAKPLAEGTPVEQQIEKKLEDLKKPAQFKRDEVKSLGKAPPLHTVNGIGTNLYSLGIKYPANPDWQYGTLYFVVLFIPLIPLKRYLVSPAPGGGWYFHAKIKFGIVQWIHLWFFALFVLLWLRP